MPSDIAGAVTRTCTADLTLDLTTPRVARELVTLLLTQWGAADEEVLDGASIVVSELVTNALLHCDDGGPIALGVHLDGLRLRLSVVDRFPAVPAQRVADAEAENGCGLSIVSQIASRWGVEPHPAGKRVYADLPLASTRCT